MGIEMPVPAKPEGVDAEVWEQMLHATPAEARHLIRESKFAAPTSGLCPGYAQANLIILPRESRPMISCCSHSETPSPAPSWRSPRWASA